MRTNPRRPLRLPTLLPYKRPGFVTDVEEPEVVPPAVEDQEFSPVTVFAPTDFDVLADAVAGDFDIDPDTLEVVTDAEHGVCTIVAGKVRYTPTQDIDVWKEPADGFTFRVQDVEGNWSNTGSADVGRTAWHCPKVLTVSDPILGTSTGDSTNFDISFTSAAGNVVVLHMGRTNSSTTLAGNLTYTWDQGGANQGMTQFKLGQPGTPAAGDFFCTGAYIRGGTTGARTLRITRNQSVGRYAILVLDLDFLPAGPLGANPGAVAGNVAQLDLPITTTQDGSLVLAWGGVVTGTDAQNPIGASSPFTRLGPANQLNTDSVPDASAHTRATVARLYAGAAGARTCSLTTANAAANTTFRGLIAELKGAAI